ncbi:potassium channel family protein [Nisaea acidiphila]|uniref:Potassium channel family protein n=1 Tax=Nisaea acidiphila TaxID=1862145 RepID=A0A9J7AQT1_9PROT|nr:potassium channel family protein [Nisaea acidiphila]UUX49242.1 potassium channel family protein [Nisaea acidiphila]
MLLPTIISSTITALTIAIHYEVLANLGRIHIRIPPRLGVVAGVFLIFLAHVLEIWLFALGLYLLSEFHELGTLEGAFNGSISDYLYFSTVTYTTLGYGDIRPTGALRTICAFEALTGLLMMAWSAAYTVYKIQRRWE